MRSLAPLILGVALFCGCASGPDWQRRAFAFTSPADQPITSLDTNIVALIRVSISPLFQSRSFTYRTSENAYKQDPYAGFLIPPERALAESIRASLRAGGVFGRVVEPGSGLVPTLVAEASINQLYGDFRHAAKPIATMEIHFICYEVQDGAPGRVVLDQVCARETPLAGKDPGALMAAWEADLREIMQQIRSEYAKAYPNAH